MVTFCFCLSVTYELMFIRISVLLLFVFLYFLVHMEWDLLWKVMIDNAKQRR